MQRLDKKNSDCILPTAVSTRQCNINIQLADPVKTLLVPWQPKQRILEQSIKLSRGRTSCSAVQTSSKTFKISWVVGRSRPLLSSLTLTVLQASTADKKNSCLCAGIYDVPSSRFGTRAFPKLKHYATKFSLRKYDWTLEEITWKKNKARRALHSAPREGESENAIRPLAARFLSFLHQHSWLSKGFYQSQTQGGQCCS